MGAVHWIGVDRHGDSVSLDYGFSNEIMFALGMNGETLNPTHGFLIRLPAPRYHGLKHVKWISELVIHRASHIDRVDQRQAWIRCGGSSFAGSCGIRALQVRADQGPWANATLEPALSGYTLNRWVAEIPVAAGGVIEARAQDGLDAWQSGVDGPRIRSIFF